MIFWSHSPLPKATRPLMAWAFTLSFAAATLAIGAEVAPLPPAAGRTVDFAKEIQPILEKSCVSCHGPEKQKGSYRLDSRAAALKGGETYDPAIKPGDSAGSPLIRLVAGLVPDEKMPAKGDPLTTGQIGLLRAWIDQGAAWPEDTRADADPILSHWAFRPVVRPPVPLAGGAVVSRAVVSEGRKPVAGPVKAAPSNSIDAFIAEKLAENGLTLSPEADRVTLIRRLFLVMLGLPPAPDDVAAFVGDREPLAFERLVDKVLADPRYGERWGRHWLDVVRFAESNGFETNRERPNGWRFRDYVIGAFNSDKPYDQFIREQIAGDALGSDVATGFLVGGPVDIVGSPDIVLTSQQRADELDDMVGTTGTAFLGLTLGCARCHSHKFDPVSHREYHAMTAVFAGVKHGERALPLPADRQAAVTEADARIAGLERRLAPFIAGPAADVAGGKLRPAVDPVRNEDAFAPVETRSLRFIITATSGGEPCIDELEIWSGDRNVALASAGTKASASGTLPGYEIHKLEHINDGRAGNNRSWISSEAGRGWIRLDLAKPERIDRVVWGRDREGGFKDRLATGYRIEVLTGEGTWKAVASSDDRAKAKDSPSKPAAPVYVFDTLPAAEAARAKQWSADLESARKERAGAAKAAMVYSGNFSQPGPTFRLHRGDPMQKREPVPPGTLAIFRPFTLATNAPEQERRVRLADWVASPDNPLTARVMVNRVWQHQFGAGLVTTPNDFGKNGARPSHPELLDWLASELVAPSGRSRHEEAHPYPTPHDSHLTAAAPRAWSIKHLQRLILTSATWRQSSGPIEAARKIDATSRLLWRFPPRRMEAEGIRDSILAVSGNLDRTAGGPSFFLHDVDRENVYHYHPKEEFTPAETRRMVYAFKVRMEQDGIFGAFDCPDGSLVTPKRSMSTTPLQALNLFNSRFILQQAEIFAARLRKEAGDDARAQVGTAWQLAFNRAPAPGELEAASGFIQAEGLPALCRAVLNANEFLFIP